MNDLDTLQDTYVKPKWRNVDHTRFPYSHSRDLPVEVASQAINYIDAIVKQYPFQLRYTMALPLWKRFTQEWCDTGDIEKSLRVI
jgi:hypothetical protein